MHNHEIQTIAIFSAQYKNIEDAENAGDAANLLI